jgi:hypothetical protein
MALSRYKLTENFGGVIRVKETNDVEIKVLLQPQNITLRSMENLEEPEIRSKQAP